MIAAVALAALAWGGSPMLESRPHVPVLACEVEALLAPAAGELALDGTLGAGGHAARLLAGVAPGGFLVGADLDPLAFELGGATLAAQEVEAGYALLRCNASELASRYIEVLPEAFAGRRPQLILLDLGVSSMQLDRPERGFSFRSDGPLDMRLDPDGGLTAADLVRDLPEAELARLLREAGEERQARRVAQAIVRARDAEPIVGTAQLARVIESALGGPRGRIHPATRTFQALRIAVNGELDALDQALARLPAALAEGGRMAVISFHSLEDRRVKRAFRALAQGGGYRLLTRKPLVASDDEVARNPRSRSAKLRGIVRDGGQA